MKTIKDPVCGMDVAPQAAADQSQYDGTTYYFCRLGCREAFDKEPGRYVGQAASAHTHACC